MSFYKIHESARPLPEKLRPVFDIWLSSQTMMSKVVRWKAWHELQGTRRQDDVQHSYSLVVLALNFIDKLHLYLYLKNDPLLIIRAVTYHEIGEGELGRDVLLANKTDAKDLEEYEAFVARFRNLSGFNRCHDAFLLQFVPKRPANFPPEAQTIMARLAEENRYDVYAFQALENLNYLFYAIEQRVTINNRDCLARVFLMARPILDSLAQKLPGLREEYWTPEFIAYCEEMALGGNTAVPK